MKEFQSQRFSSKLFTSCCRKVQIEPFQIQSYQSKIQEKYVKSKLSLRNIGQKNIQKSELKNIGVSEIKRSLSPRCFEQRLNKYSSVELIHSTNRVIQNTSPKKINFITLAQNKMNKRFENEKMNVVSGAKFEANRYSNILQKDLQKTAKYQTVTLAHSKLVGHEMKNTRQLLSQVKKNEIQEKLINFKKSVVSIKSQNQQIETKLEQSLIMIDFFHPNHSQIKRLKQYIEEYPTKLSKIHQ